jgi:hypothetical protein
LKYLESERAVRLDRLTRLSDLLAIGRAQGALEIIEKLMGLDSRARTLRETYNREG